MKDRCFVEIIRLGVIMKTLRGIDSNVDTCVCWIVETDFDSCMPVAQVMDPIDIITVQELCLSIIHCSCISIRLVYMHF